jgi:phenylacetate-CoA ligase
MISAAWGSTLRRVLLPTGDQLFGQQMIRRFNLLERAQWWDKDQIGELRMDLLRETCSVAYRDTPFYRRLFDQAGLEPRAIREEGDLMRLPIVTKEMLKAAYPREVTRPTGQRCYEVMTSGSTGKNFVVLEDAYTAGWYRASFLLALHWAGWRFGEPHLQTGMTHERSLDRRLKDWLLRCYYSNAAMLDNRSLDQSLDLMRKRRISHLWGYPGSLYQLALRASERQWERPLASIVTWGDNLYPHYRSVIESAFHTTITDTYGIGEGTHIAAQCSEAKSYHIHSLDVIVEVVADDGSKVSPGEQGNILITRLHPGPMPLIRYRIGDIVTRGDSSPCACGRGFETLGGVQGRDTDYVVTPSGNRLIVHYFTGILEHFKTIDEFQIVQDRLESIQLNIVPAQGWNSTVAGEIIRSLKVGGGSDLDIRIELVNQIPLTRGGKRRFIISRVLSPHSNS